MTLHLSHIGLTLALRHFHLFISYKFLLLIRPLLVSSIMVVHLHNPFDLTHGIEVNPDHDDQ